MNHNSEQNIIKEFFQGHFSGPLQTKFRWWLLNSDTQKENEEAMEEIWDSLPNIAGLSTLDDLERAKKQLKADTPVRNHRRRYIWRIAAAIAVLMVVTAATYFAARYHFYSLMASQEFVQVSVPDGSLRQLILADGTHVTVGAGSSIVYPKDFTSNTRKVFLIGQARFKVSKDPDRPFIVETQQFAVTALGTEFDLTNYPDEQKAATTLLHGVTQVTLNNKRGESTQKNLLLHPNERFSYDKLSGSYSIERVDADSEMAWSTGQLDFEAATFGSVLDKLQRRFGVKFICSDNLRRQGSYTVQIRRDDNLEKVLNILAVINQHFTWQRQGNVVVITEKK